MDTVPEHPHAFDPADWPFRDEPVNRVTFASAGFIRDGEPVRVVYHDHDGDWQVLHADIADDEECLIVCLGCAWQREPAIGELADLPPGWRAWRSGGGTAWQREPFDEPEDEDAHGANEDADR